ncbi:MAG: helix-turn-helix transcriptional regulator [Eggerthellaceae bacterium]|nr:helix-turn-helix transcriptional regulator [Eggerthellaceae bacterium]
MIVENLNDLMSSRGMTPDELANRMGVSTRVISRIAIGDYQAMRKTTLEMLCRELDCQPGDLLEYIPELPA